VATFDPNILAPAPFALMVKKTIGGAKNGKTREVPEVKAPKWYPADDIKAKVPSERDAASKGIAKLKKNIKPGSVLIMLGGRFRGKRVVFLKQLSSGLLLVTGPYQLNGVPIRRANQAYCITTSATVDIKGIDVSKIDDPFFARAKKAKAEFFSGEAPKVETSPERVAAQKAVDDKLMASIKKVPMMDKYLKTLFSLSNGDVPHKMKF